jgi:probable rRNA maturation factor
VLGDVVLCPAVAEAQARTLGRRIDHELAHLLVHGILHLLGREHGDPLSERAMAREERQILSALGLRA